MKPRKGKTFASGSHVAGQKRSKSRQLILLDQGPLRREAASECGREMARLEKAKAEWKRFESEDKTRFERWLAATFGPLLSRLREVEAAIREKGSLIQEVEMEMFFGGARNPRTAYARVMERRNSPPPAVDPEAGPWEAGGPPPPPGDDAGDPDFGSLDEFEEVLLFEDYLECVLGLNPDRMSDEKYDRLFDEFRKNVLNAARSQSLPEQESYTAPVPAKPQQPEQSRVKELYRLLVRRLHPDTRAESDAQVSALWHEVQEAYSAGNVERLEMLLALTDMQANEVGDHTTLSQMRSVLAELRRSYNALKRNLGDAKKDPAWNFSRLTDRAPLQKRLRSKFTFELEGQEIRLRHIEALLADWSIPPKARKNNKAAKTPGAKKHMPAFQMDIPF